MKPLTTLYCIADEAGFRILRGKGSEIDEVLKASAEAFEDVAHEFGKNGRNRAGSGATSFGHDTKSAAEIERPRLAKHVVRALGAEWSRGGADRIVVAAGPKMLGALREAMPGALTGHIAAELSKDLSDIPAHALYAHFEGVTRI